jgi:hypothetical protein
MDARGARQRRAPRQRDLWVTAQRLGEALRFSPRLNQDTVRNR